MYISARIGYAMSALPSLMVNCVLHCPKRILRRLFGRQGILAMVSFVLCLMGLCSYYVAGQTVPLIAPPSTSVPGLLPTMRSTCSCGPSGSCTSCSSTRAVSLSPASAVRRPVVHPVPAPRSARSPPVRASSSAFSELGLALATGQDFIPSTFRSHSADVASGSTAPPDTVPMDAMVGSFQADSQDPYEMFNARVGLSTFDDADSEQMQSLLASHGLHEHLDNSLDQMKCVLIHHFCQLACSFDTACAPACRMMRSAFTDDDVSSQASLLQLRLHVFEQVGQKLGLRDMRKLLIDLRLPHEHSDTLNKLRAILREYARQLSHGKPVNGRESKLKDIVARLAATRIQNANIGARWPEMLDSSQKEKLIKCFREETSSSHLRSVTCACCGESHFARLSTQWSFTDFPSNLLHMPQCCCTQFIRR